MRAPPVEVRGEEGETRAGDNSFRKFGCELEERVKTYSNSADLTTACDIRPSIITRILHKRNEAQRG